VLYSSEDGNWKIGDFGLTVPGTSKNPIETSERKGTGSYRAPELVREQQYNNKVDVWAFGCIAWELVTEQKAFSSDFETYEWSKFSDAERRFPAEFVPEEGPRELLSRIVSGCLQRETNIRPSARDLSKWLRDYLGFENGPKSGLSVFTDLGDTLYSSTTPIVSPDSPEAISPCTVPIFCAVTNVQCTGSL
jgi:serine/threonine protein kinase